MWGILHIVLLILFAIFMPISGRCSDVVLASQKYVNKIVESIKKSNNINAESKDDELATAGAVWRLVESINSDLDDHVNNMGNPHSVTAEQVGLGNVKNVDTTDATNISSGQINYNLLPVGTTKNTVAAGNDSRFYAVPVGKPSGDAPQGTVWMWFE